MQQEVGGGAGPAYPPYPPSGEGTSHGGICHGTKDVRGSVHGGLTGGVMQEEEGGPRVVMDEVQEFSPTQGQEDGGLNTPVGQSRILKPQAEAVEEAAFQLLTAFGPWPIYKRRQA